MMADPILFALRWVTHCERLIFAVLRKTGAPNGGSHRFAQTEALSQAYRPIEGRVDFSQHDPRCSLPCGLTLRLPESSASRRPSAFLQRADAA